MVGLLFPAIFFSLLFLTAIWKAPNRPAGNCFVAWAIGIVFILALLTDSHLLAWQAGLSIFLVGALTVFGGGLAGRRMGAVASFVGATALVLYFGALQAHRFDRERDQLLRQYPLVSVADRLAYETAGAAPTVTVPFWLSPVPPVCQISVRPVW